MPLSLNKNQIRISAITGLFVLLYFLLRILPDSECGFLHYEEVVNANGEIEFCATNSAGFIDLTQLDYPVDLLMSWDANSKEGTLSLEMDGGHFLLPHELAYTHTEKIHLLLIDESLEDYHHIHPRSEGMDKVFRFNFEPARSGAYQVYAEVVPKRTRRQLIASNQLELGGVSSEQSFSLKQSDIQAAMQFELLGVPERLKPNQDYRFTLKVRDMEGNRVTLETIMDAKAHMVAFDADRRGFAHMHPLLDPLAEVEEDEDLSFLFNVPREGWYRLFAQVQKNGTSIYAHFDLKVGS